jgi:hypothetical protein
MPEVTVMDPDLEVDKLISCLSMFEGIYITSILFEYYKYIAHATPDAPQVQRITNAALAAPTFEN